MPSIFFKNKTFVGEYCAAASSYSNNQTNVNVSVSVTNI